MKTLILKFAGPLQSWGIASHFETRNTSRYPSKSGVIGLIAAALGYRRSETERIQKLNSLSFAVRVDQPGTILRDFHIAAATKQTYVTNRYYLQDAIFLVAISHENNNWIDEIEYALKHPVFQLFMGRRANPIDSHFFLENTEKDIETVINEYKWQASEWYQKKYFRENSDTGIVKLDAYFDAELFDMESNPIISRDRVVSFSQSHREFDFRPICIKNVSLKRMDDVINTKHDAFEAIGGL